MQSDKVIVNSASEPGNPLCLKNFRATACCCIRRTRRSRLLSRDPNQFKQDLQDLAAEQSGYQVTINGDIRWRWALPFGVSAEDIAATADSETITVDRLTLGISFGSLFAAFDDWKINTLHLQDVYWEDSESIIRISDFHLQDFRTGVSSPFAMQVGYESTDPDPIIVTADIAGRLNYGDNDVLRFADTKVSSNLAVGTAKAP